MCGRDTQWQTNVSTEDTTGPNHKKSTQEPLKDRSDHTGQTQCQDIMKTDSQGQSPQSTVDSVFVSVLHVETHGGDGLRGHLEE